MLFRNLKFFAALAAVLALTSFARAQRLPEGVHPESYTLILTPDLKAATFTGDETITVTLEKPSKTITLNAAEITFVSVAVAGQTATVSLDPDKEQATFTFANTLPAGKVTLAIKYTGILNGQLRGFYLSKTARRNYAVTQFEPTDARRAYPSFDEPALKATYSLTLIIDKGDTAISNTDIISDTPGPGPNNGNAKHTLHFATTPRMSTYLVAFLVGDFQCLSSSSDGVPIRVCATPDKFQYGKLALDTAVHTLHYYDTYFGIKYPMPKLDMIALPDFEAGAMENFGAITYRETDLLADDATASIDHKKRVAVVVTHEMAHQWFGDMVTMQWWDNLWLNEGFATWMESKAANVYKPEWNYKQDDALDLDNEMNADSQATTRTIRAKAETPSEINEMFDGIAYQKGGAVLGMVEHYLGEETFRQGVHNYLAAHMYANATAEDFWNAQTATSHKPVDKIMESFVTLPGVPLLTFSAQAGGKLPIAQSRFFLAAAPTAQHWTIPVCFKTDNNASRCELLSEEHQSLTLPTVPFMDANAGYKGYYRSAYTRRQYDQLVANAETDLAPPERIGLLGDTWALMRSGQGTVANFMDLVAALHQDKEAEVLSNALAKVGTVSIRIATDDDRARLNAWIRAEFGPVYRQLGPASPSDSIDKNQLRGQLFATLGGAKDPAVVAEAKELANKYVADQSSVDPSVAGSAVIIAASTGDAVFYEKLLNLSKTATDPEVQNNALFDLARFTDPALITRTMDYDTSGAVRNQDSWVPMSILLQTRETREQTWKYIQQNWDKVHAQFTTASGSRIVAAAGSFCTAERRDDVASFFAIHKVDAADRTLKKAIDSINDCIQLRAAQEPSLKQWLDANAK